MLHSRPRLLLRPIHEHIAALAAGRRRRSPGTPSLLDSDLGEPHLDLPFHLHPMSWPVCHPRGRAPPAGGFPMPKVAAAVASAAPSTPGPRSWHKWVTRAVLSPPSLSPARISPGRTEIGHLRQCSAAGALLRRAPSPPLARIVPGRPILLRRSRLERRNSLIQTARLRSNGQYPRIPVRPGIFAKEPLRFSTINPRSIFTQKYLQISPIFLQGTP